MEYLEWGSIMDTWHQMGHQQTLFVTCFRYKYMLLIWSQDSWRSSQNIVSFSYFEIDYFENSFTIFTLLQTWHKKPINTSIKHDKFPDFKLTFWGDTPQPYDATVLYAWFLWRFTEKIIIVFKRLEWADISILFLHCCQVTQCII